MKDIDEFQLTCRRTVNPAGDCFENYAFGLAGEAGEIADMIKKADYQGHFINTEELNKEIGDLVWYACNMAYKAGINMSEVLDCNITKLQKRFPQGFDPTRSRNRVE
jgi:NTP pyrophosphatase (non-canonical NTP hydrolase)